MAINGDERLNPLRCGFPVGDTVGGLNAAFAIMAALFHRQRSGEGQMIDVALLDSILPMMGWVAANLLIGKQQPQLMGNDNFTAAPSGTFRTADGSINIAANQQQQWEDLAAVLGAPELTNDPRFQERDARKKNRALLTPLLEEKLTTRPTAHWVEALNAKGIPSGSIATLEEALTSPQVAHRRSIASIHADGLGELKLFTLTAKFDKTPGTIESPPPRLSQHTDEILGQLGYSEGDIAALRSAGAI
jgi:crotonobetainyl-CoA:carnitine CoA-transferase CaiB-like acyl-CoA transferase